MEYLRFIYEFRARASALEVMIPTNETNLSIVPYGMPPLNGRLEVKSPFFGAMFSLSVILKNISSSAAINPLQNLVTCLAKQITKL